MSAIQPPPTVSILAGAWLGLSVCACDAGDATPASASTFVATAPSSGTASSAAIATTSSAAPVATAPATSASASASDAPGGAGPIARLKQESLAQIASYDGKPIKVEGLFVKTSRRTYGGHGEFIPHTAHTIWVADTKDDVDHLLRCEVGGVWPAAFTPFEPITIEGKAAFKDASTIHNGPPELRVVACKVKKR